MIGRSKSGTAQTISAQTATAWLLGISLLLQTGVSHAEQQASEQQLKQLRQDIGTIQQSLDSDKTKQQQYQRELRKLEQAIAKLSRQQRQAQQQLKQQQQTQQQLSGETNTLRRNLSRQQHNLSQQFRAGYSSGQQQALKLLLNQTDPNTAGRNMIYYGYFTRAQLDSIKQTQESIQQLNKSEARLQQSNDRLNKLQRNYNQRKQELLDQQKQRKQLVSKLGSEISNKEQRLNRLREDEKALSKLLQSLPSPLPGDLTLRDLGKLKGKLKWPTKGKIRNRFGSSRNQGRMKWQGVTISGSEGQDIKAIAPGQVIFADWIRGYGLMLIVDHGQGYMSLYGHNQSLYKDVGDSVASNEVIAALGNSGGNTDTSLYFEMRHKGKPVNPATWCR